MNTKTCKIRYENMESPNLKGLLTDDNHISTPHNYRILLQAYQDPDGPQKGEYEFESAEITDTINIPSEIIWCGETLLNVVVYQLFIPHGSKYKLDDMVYWERMEDHLLRRKIFERGWVVDYNSGYILGVQTPFLNVYKGFQPAGLVSGYQMWQKYKMFKKKY